MKIAFLILVHKEPEQINMLINKCLKFDSEIFIHIDRKNYIIKKDIITNNRVHILDYDDSYDIYWGNNNMVRAQICLITKAKEYSIRNSILFDYFWCLSGQDYFIMNTNMIIAQLDSNKSLNYIQVLNSDRIQKQLFYKRVEVKYPTWKSFNDNNFKSKVIKNIYQIITGGRRHTFRLFRRKLPFKQMYFGSSWWILNYDFCNYVLECLNNEESYLSFYDNSICPDESFFQTLIMNSRFNSTVVDNRCYVSFKNRNPYIITINDISVLQQNSCSNFVARKFDIKVDKNIIDVIDHQLLGEGNAF